MVIPINTLTDISITLTRVLPSIFWGGCVPPTIEKITICLPRYSVVNMLNMNPFHGFHGFHIHFCSFCSLTVDLVAPSILNCIV